MFNCKYSCRINLHDQEVADRISKSVGKTESFIYELLLQGQISKEISDQLDIKKSAQFIHNSLIGGRVLAKTIETSKHH